MVAKLRRNVPDYLFGSGTRGNVIVFEADELQRFLGISILSNRNPLGDLRAQLRLLPIPRMRPYSSLDLFTKIVQMAPLSLPRTVLSLKPSTEPMQVHP